MAFSILGFNFGRSSEASKVDTDRQVDKPKQPVSFATPDLEDGAVTIQAGGYFGQYVDFEGNISNDIQLIARYRSMSLHPEIDSAIDDIVNESVVANDGKQVVDVLLDDVDASEETKQTIADEFRNVLRLSSFSKRSYEIFRKWYVDSKLYFHAIYDENNKDQGVLEFRPIDPTLIRKIREVVKEKNQQGVEIVKEIREYYVYNEQQSMTYPLSGIKITPECICYIPSGLVDSAQRRSVGYLHKAIKALNQLRMIEDAVVIYRLSRAPERRVFYIDVGNLPKIKAEQYVRDLMLRYRNKLMYDATTGELADDRRHMSMLEDFWLPRTEGGKGTEVTTLPGGQNLGEIQDVEYFQKKLYAALNVPSSRLVSQEAKNFSIGRTTEITRDEIKFGKFIERLRNNFSGILYQMLKIQLILKGIVTPEEWEKLRDKIGFRFNRDMYFAELKNMEIARERLTLANEYEPMIGKYYSKAHVQRTVLQMTEEEIAEMKREIEQEAATEQAATAAAEAPEEGDESDEEDLSATTSDTSEPDLSATATNDNDEEPDLEQGPPEDDLSKR